MCPINKCPLNNIGEQHIWWSEELILKPSCIWFLYDFIFHEFLFSSHLLYLNMQVLPLRFNFWDFSIIHKFHCVILSPSEIWRFTVTWGIWLFSAQTPEHFDVLHAAGNEYFGNIPKIDAVDLKTQHSINWLSAESKLRECF